MNTPDIEVVPAGTLEPVRVTVTMPATHLCPFRKETDQGTATLEWFTRNGQTIELHSLRAALDALAGWTVSHEQYTQHLLDRLEAAVDAVVVTTRWNTAGGQVEVTAA